MTISKQTSKKVIAPKKLGMQANLEIITGLEKMKRKYELEKERGKVMGYQKAIATLKALKDPITSVSQLNGLPGVGAGIQKKVQEYFDNGVFREVKDPFCDKKMKGLDALQKIWGVGTQKASSLYS